MYDEMAFLQLFGNDAFISVNKHLAKQIGLVEACFFGELISKYKHYKSQNQLIDNKWFYVTIKSIEESIGLKEDWQESVIKKLVKTGLIEKKRMGLPAKRYFSINVQKLMDIYLKKQDESNGENDKKQGEKQDEPLIQSDSAKTRNKTRLKPETRLGSNPKQDSAKTPTIKRNNKKNLKKEVSKKSIYLSKLNELDKLPMQIKITMKNNIDRLIDNSIDPYDIYSFYFSSENKANEFDFNTILGNVLSSTKGPIRNINQLLVIAVQNYMHDLRLIPDYDETIN
jgi:hypothetical protein